MLVAPDREGIYQVGFVTNGSPQATRALAEEPLSNVFVPHSPNPTAGKLVLVPESEVHEVDVPVRKGLRLLVTTGLGVDDIEPATLPESVAGTPGEATDRSPGGAGS